MVKKISHSVIILFILCAVFSIGASDRPTNEAFVKLPDGFPPIEQSEAYQEYLRTPQNHLAKLLFGLKYFKTLPLILKYDDGEYPMQFCYPIGLAYLMMNYHDEDPVKWIRKHCYRSLIGNKIMYFKFTDGSYRSVRDVFTEFYHTLEKIQQR